MRLVTSALVLALISPMAFAVKLYRFEVDGRTILKDHIPPEYAQMQYDILNDQGLVIRRVQSAPTVSELAEIAAKKAIKSALIERIRIQREADQSLLRVYSKPADVERARKRSTDNIDGYISLQKRRIVSLTEKLERAQGRAANQERAGAEIPADMRLEIAQLQNQIRESHANVKIRIVEKSDNIKAYAAEYARMQILLKYPPGTLDSDIPLE
jgi:hypothetical protein